MHTVAVLVLDGVVPFDLSAPIDAFGWARLPDGRPAYRVRVCSPSASGEVSAGAFTVRAPYGVEALAEADTIILPGVANPPEELPPGVAEALRDAAADGTRIASVCVGAFLFAATGLLDGLRATTHWVAARELAERYPKVEVDPNVLYVDHDRFLTSAGAAAALDMCLHMIRKDYGSAVAAQAARMSVMPLEREGGQAQFIVHDLSPAPSGATLEPLLVWLEDNCADDLTLNRIAERAGMSARTLNRRFREQTGTTPLRWLHRARVRRAQHLLESTGYPVERIAAQAGFGSPTAFRECFRKVAGTSPQGYRRAFRSRTGTGPGVGTATGAGAGAEPRERAGAGARTGGRPTGASERDAMRS
ncbi:GlxA family transcriptional regulator [Streptomyces sp. NPDC058291]|uniref:GlxA family transcriptional regulator n=1 Tax=Streptomyces sp. NPDC058291 TaxID=3346427 RepID=UPI0036E1D704